MPKGFKFGTPKHQPKKEPKNDDKGIDVTDIVNTHIDNHLETIAQLRQEKEEFRINLNKYTNLSQLLVTESEEKGEKITELENELFTKDTNIQGYNETIEALNIRIVELTEANLELEETQTQEEKPSPYVPSGFKKPITDEIIEQMRDYAKSILDKKGTIKFYEEIGKKFGIASGSAYKYCKDIYQGE